MAKILITVSRKSQHLIEIETEYFLYFSVKHLAILLTTAVLSIRTLQ